MPINASPNKFKTERYDLITETFPAPGIGVTVTWPCPDNRVVEVVSVVFVLNTSAFVANRYPVLTLEVGGLNLLNTLSGVPRTAGGNYQYMFSLRVDAVDLSAANGVVVEPLATAWEMKPGDNLLITAYGWDVGDWFGNIRFRYREWKED